MDKQLCNQEEVGGVGVWGKAKINKIQSKFDDLELSFISEGFFLYFFLDFFLYFSSSFRSSRSSGLIKPALHLSSQFLLLLL